MLQSKPVQRLMHRQQFVIRHARHDFHLIQIDPLLPPPCRTALLFRARSIRMRRIASAAATKKWVRFSQLCLPPPTRIQASCTKAVACNV